MILGCPTVADDAGFAERMAGYVECRSAQIDLAPFQGGMWHGLPAALVTVLMVLYVATIGYRLVLSRRLDVADLVYAAARLGVVIALATTLSAFSALFYNVATQGPTELAAMALAPTGLQSVSPTQASHDVAADLAILAPTAPQASAGGDPAVVRAATPNGPSADIGGAVLVLSCAGFGLAARLALAVVLASGPLFIATALFDLSTGLFIGWLRALAALFLAQTGYAVSAALELSFLAQDVERLPQAPNDTGEPLGVGLFFLAAGLAVGVVSILVSGGLLRGISLRRPGTASPGAPSSSVAPTTAPSLWRTTDIRIDHALPRAQGVSDAVSALAIAEAQRHIGGGEVAGVPRAATMAPRPNYEPLVGAGPGLRRPGQLRASTGAAMRDKIS